MKPTKAIIAVAGYGTRRLPVAKAVDKCMLPLLNRPVVDYIVQDVVKAGVRDIYFVVNDDDPRQLREYYSRNDALEAYLAEHGKADLIPSILPPEDVRFHSIKQDLQDARYGTTIPLWCCREVIAPNETFYLIMGDQTLWRKDGQSEVALLAEQVVQSGADAGLTGVEVPWKEVEHYGVIVQDAQGMFQNIVEKPRRDEAPSNLNNASIYVLPGNFMHYVDKQVAQTQAGEYYIIDVLNDFVADGHSVAVRQSDAAYLDCGTVAGLST